LPGENPTASTEVGLSVMTAEAPNREIEYRPYHDFLQYVNGPLAAAMMIMLHAEHQVARRE